MSKLLITVSLVLAIAAPAEADRRDRERRDSHRLRNATIAIMLLIDDDLERCQQEYLIHYGDQVLEGCVRDIMAAESIPLEIRQEWYNTRFAQ